MNKVNTTTNSKFILFLLITGGILILLLIYSKFSNQLPKNNSNTTTKMLFTSFRKEKMNENIYKFIPVPSMKWNQVIHALQNDAHFRNSLSKTIIEIPFHQVFFECIPAIPNQLDKTDFEYVLIDATSTSLFDAAKNPDYTTFKEHFIKKPSGVKFATFANSGGDATLIAPSPLLLLSSNNRPRPFGTISSFMRNTNEDEQQELWQHVGIALSTRLFSPKATTTWLSTSGTGVSWLHVRLDSRPKYYNFQPYM
jgi:hypothetical protein